MALYDAGEMRIVVGPGPALIPSRYGERRQIRWSALAAVLGFHAVLALTLDLAGMLPVRRAPSELKLIQLSPEMAPPPPVFSVVLPKQVETPREVQVQAEPQSATMDAPTPFVVPAAAPIIVTPAPAPSPPPAPTVLGPVAVSDLDAKVIAIVPPKYPVESRRRREQGTVVLAVTLTLEGSVDAVELARSSGFERLDKAALEAVRRWRWSPTLREGTPVAVKGTVDIPFILKG